MTRLALILLLAASPAAAGRYEACVAEAKAAPARAVETATAWRIAGGGIAARHCLGVAYVAQGKYTLGALAFEDAARLAAKGSGEGELWGQAGNAQLLAGDAAKAMDDLNAALAASGGAPARRQGELLIDRARAARELGKTSDAKDDLDKAVKLAPADPDGWLLRGVLAREGGRYDDAARDVAEALRLSPADPDALLEAGNVAGARGDAEAAEVQWRAAVAAAPDSPAGRAAAAALANR